MPPTDAFHLLVASVKDYAIFMLDSDGPRRDLERRAPSASRAIGRRR